MTHMSRAEIAQARDICAKAGALLVVNDYWQAAIDLKCAYVHLGQGDLDSADVPALRRAGTEARPFHTRSCRTRSRALLRSRLRRARADLSDAAEADALGAAGSRPDRRMEAARSATRPLVAIGGLTLERIPGVLAAGADCVAVVTDIVRATDPEAQTRAWVKATRRV